MFNLCRWVFFYILTVVVVTGQPTPTAPPRADPYGLYNHFDPSMVIVVMVLVGVFFLLGFLSVYIRHCNEAQAMAIASAAAAASSSQMFRPKGLDPEVIESFPIFVYSYVKDLQLGKAALECAVCLSEFQDEEILRLIPKCCHVFHPDCIDAWLAYHVTCPVCRAKLTPDSDTNAEPVESCSNITELNSNNNSNSNSSPPTTPRAEEENELVIQINEIRPKITGKFPRSNSTGHSLIQAGENTERFTLRLPEEIRKQIAKSGRLKRTRSYDVVLGMECSSKNGEGSSRVKSITDRWVFSVTPPFVSKMRPIKSPKGGGDGGDGSNSWRGLTAVKEKLNCLNLKVEQVDKEDSSSHSPV
ncbi:putative Argonaute protein group [Hibiscus syriacus]|uniref:RING-type E3 ubiquitin transferase n=1 Tax=Hibiscus syriacus TaxID=106335 RepID=A0A6A3APW5_HIBSY|nr:E3 ubiquitin-protein ligase ATL31-like [Hibiscus syriacus]KAE8704932.1 putative Argonaute protein group [Hibiscus syriacus]